MRLLGRTGKLRGQTHAISGPTRMGRGPENELAILVEGVSRRHAQIVPDETGFWLEDLDSSNGTMLNGQRIKRERLEHLDVISLGRGADLIVDTRRTDEMAATSKMARPANIVLEALDGPQEGTRIEVRPGELSIGRTAPATLLVENPAVSKVHARLRRTANAVVLEDFQSANGTYVNADRVSEPVALKDGDRISIAGLRTFKISITGAPPVAVVPTPAPAGEPERPKEGFDQEWRTKLVWSPDELALLDAAKVGGMGKTAPRPAPANLTPLAEGPPTSPRREAAEQAAARTQFYDTLPSPPPTPGSPRVAPPASEEPAAGTQHFDSLPMPPPTPASPRGSAPPASDEPAAGTQHFDSLPMPPPTPASPRVPPRPAATDEPAAGTQHFDSLPMPPVTPPVRPAPRSAAPEAEAPRTQHFDSLPEAPPVPARRTPVPPPVPPPGVPVTEAPTQRFESLALPPTPVVSRAPAMRAVRLRGASQEFLLKEGQHQVGRQESCPVAVLDRQVSRNHATITVTATTVSIEDLKSANGTTVNGKRISTPTPLQPGDRVGFGGIEFTIEVLGQG